MHGQFVLVQLEHEDEAVLGRITSVSAESRLVPGRRVLLARSGGRPGLADVPLLTERTVVFTTQQPPSLAYGSSVVDSVKLDIRQLSAQRVIGIALPADRQDQQNVTKLKSLGPDRWRRLVDLVAAHRYHTDPAEVRRLCGIKTANEELQTNAIIANMTRVVDAPHDPSSQLLRALMTALRAGRLRVVDIENSPRPFRITFRALP